MLPGQRAHRHAGSAALTRLTHRRYRRSTQQGQVRKIRPCCLAELTGCSGRRKSVTDHVVLILGAGPTGLVLALWLTRLGVRVRIIDKTAEPGTTSRALAVQARTLELYQQVGLADAVVEAGVKIQAVNLWVGGRQVARLPLG